MTQVLVIECAWPERSLLYAQLEAEGFEATGVERLQEVLPRLTGLELRPDLVVLDSQGQAWSETELRELRDALAGVPLLILASAYDSPSLPALKQTADAVLVRPVSIGQVVDAVGQLCRSR